MLRRPARTLPLLLLSVAALWAPTAAEAFVEAGPGRILAAGDDIDLVNPANGSAHDVVKNRGTEPALVPGSGKFVYIRDGGCATDGHGGCFTEYSVFVKSLKSPPATPGRRLFGWKDFFVREVDVSPQGRVVFSAKPGPGPDGERLDIYSSNMAGKQVRRLTRSPAFENDPVVSPDGRRIAFVRKVHGRGQIFEMRIDGSHLVRLTDDGRRDRLPSWAPDGHRLVFISQPGGQFSKRDVRTVTTGGVERTLATVPRGDVDHPVYSPDGRSIAFLRQQGIWLMSNRGHHKRLLRRPPGIAGYEGGMDWGR